MLILAQCLGATLLAGVGLAALLSSSANASTLTSGPVSLTTTGNITSGIPYSSGQTITVTLAANSTMSQTNLATFGFPGGVSSASLEECTDQDGLADDLPTKPGECQAASVVVSTGLNADGSLSVSGYTIYAFPDSNLGVSNGVVCDNGANACVVGIFSNQNNFSDPHLFSAPFYVSANSDDGDEDPGDGSPQVATPVSASKSTVVASPLSVVADGADASRITVTLLDQNGVPVQGGKQVQVSQGSGTSTIDVNGSASATATTDSSTGVAIFDVTSTIAQSDTYSFTDVSDSTPLSTQVSVAFSAPTVSASNSTITAVPTTVMGGSTSIITVTLEDQAASARPIAGEMVSLTQGAGSSVVSPASGTTNSQGQVTFTASDAATETVTYGVMDVTTGKQVAGLTRAVTFGILTVSPSASTVTSSPDLVSIVSPAVSTVTVTLLAADGHSPVTGKTVTLAANSATTTITPTESPSITDANGTATFTVADGTAEVVKFTATDVSDGNLPITTSASVTFAAPTASATRSTMSESASTDAADGVTSVSLNVTVTDQFGNPLAGRVVTVAGVPGTTTRIPAQTESSSIPAGTTNASGEAVFHANDTTAETVVYTATDTTDNVTLTQTQSVIFEAGLPQINNSNIGAAPLTVPADGATASTVTVTLDDHNGNPVPNKAISLDPLNGSATVTPVSATSNAQGQAVFSVTDSTAEVATFSATDTTDSLPLVGQGVSVTFGTPAPIPPSIADSTIVGTATSAPADGKSSVTISVVLSDSDGNPLPAKTVALNPSLGTTAGSNSRTDQSNAVAAVSAAAGSSVITTVTGTTDTDGTATFTVTDTTAETVTYGATDVSDDLPLTGLSVSVSFTAVSGSAVGSTGTSSTTGTTGTSGSTTGTTVPSSSSTSGTTSPTSATAAALPASSSGSSSNGSSLAFTGTPTMLPWLVGLGLFLIMIGSLGRRIRPRET